jgi:hypothetical protein
VACRVLHDYGAMFSAQKYSAAALCVFTSDDEVSQFQNAAGWSSESLATQ